MVTVPHITAWAGSTKYQADGFLFDEIHRYWVAVDVGGDALCCEHGAVRQNVHGYVCCNRNRAVVIIGGTSGIADCCCVAFSSKGNKSWIALSTVNNSSLKHTHKHAPSAETQQYLAFHRSSPSSHLYPHIPAARCSPLAVTTIVFVFLFLNGVTALNGPRPFIF